MGKCDFLKFGVDEFSIIDSLLLWAVLLFVIFTLPSHLIDRICLIGALLQWAVFSLSKNRPDGLSRTSGDDGRLWVVLLQWAV